MYLFKLDATIWNSDDPLYSVRNMMVINKVRELGKWSALGIISLATLLLGIDVTVLALALPSLSLELSLSAIEQLWVSDSYSLAMAGLMIPMAVVADRYGAKKTLIVGVVGFGISSALGALATTGIQLIFARILMGMFAAMFTPASLSMIHQLFNDKRTLGMAIALWSMSAAIGSAIGPIIGGGVIELFGWQTIFLINLLLVPMYVILSPLLPSSKGCISTSIDGQSVGLIFFGLVLTLLGFKQLILSDHFLLSLICLSLGLACITNFYRRQSWLTKPMLDLSIFSWQQRGPLLLAHSMALFALTGSLFFLSLYFQWVIGLKPFYAGLCELPLVVGYMLCSGGLNLIRKRFEAEKVVLGGLLVAACGLLIVAMAVRGEHLIFMMCGTFFAGIGMAATYATSTELLLSSAPENKAASVAGVSETTGTIGETLGIAVLGTMMLFMYRASIPPLEVLPLGAQLSLSESAGAAFKAALNWPQWSELILSTAKEGMITGMLVTTSVAAVLLVICASLIFMEFQKRRLTLLSGCRNE
ncbi:MFS transporter [Pseudoalteromonas ostreae]|uniref:MFS transporter n=1 Tax=Pseudoalteromonas ostreae TaxID=2774154 RepID=UPI001B361E94|nr:MFS transporter [Pseudoalteromonas ostreae]